MQYEVSREMYNFCSLAGTSLGILSLNKNISSLVGYPNPAENRITITNNLENGQNATLRLILFLRCYEKYPLIRYIEKSRSLTP